MNKTYKVFEYDYKNEKEFEDLLNDEWEIDRADHRNKASSIVYVLYHHNKITLPKVDSNKVRHLNEGVPEKNK